MIETPRPLVVRAPNHLGDLVMALPALRSVRADTVVLARWLVPLLELAGVTKDIVPLDRGLTGMLSAARQLRRRSYARGILLTPSFSSVLVFRFGGVRSVRGSGTDRRELLLDDIVPRTEIAAGHRILGYLLLATGRVPDEAPAPAVAVPDELAQRWRNLAGGRDGRPTVGLFPGSQASSRRWDVDRFAAVARGLVRDGVNVVVFGGSSERHLTARAADTGALDAGGRTDLPLLAAGLASCDILVTNDSGPMHLAAAVGTRTLSLQGPSNPASTGPGGPGHRMIQRPDLPCVPCVQNTCPRSGAGFILPNAKKECLNLITPADVLSVARSMLDEC